MADREGREGVKGLGIWSGSFCDEVGGIGGGIS